MELNPYSTPRAELQSQNLKPVRPGWVWAIFILYVLSAISTVASFGLIMSGSLDLPEDQRQYLANLSATDYAISFLIASINLTAAILLFRLRKASFHFFMASLLLNVLVTIWHATTNGFYPAAGGAGIVGILASYAFRVAICFYVWRLVRNGTLK